jgi:hypothetical protein
MVISAPSPRPHQSLSALNLPLCAWLATGDLSAFAVRMATQEDGPLQLSLFDERDLAEISSPDFPGERLIVCRNRDLARERARNREALLLATERELARIQAQVHRKGSQLHAAVEIGLAVGEVVNARKMAKHFTLDIGDGRFIFGRKVDQSPLKPSSTVSMSSMSSAPACRQPNSAPRMRYRHTKTSRE